MFGFSRPNVCAVEEVLSGNNGVSIYQKRNRHFQGNQQQTCRQNTLSSFRHHQPMAIFGRTYLGVSQIYSAISFFFFFHSFFRKIDTCIPKFLSFHTVISKLTSISVRIKRSTPRIW